jgi:YidC/Oxa1 family membrane protein insertase
LHQSFQGAMNAHPQQVAVMVIAAVMVVLMTGSQFLTQLQIVSKNMSPETKASPQFKQQRILLYLLPFVFLFSGFAFPLGVMFYWLTSNLWTMGQQFLVIRNLPTPGSDAAKAREARLARKGKLVQDGSVVLQVEEVPQKPVATQRVQPVSKNRAKKQAGKK